MAPARRSDVGKQFDDRRMNPHFVDCFHCRRFVTEFSIAFGKGARETWGKNHSCRQCAISLLFSYDEIESKSEEPLSIITSLSNPKIKEAVKLRDGKHRRRTGTFLIDGNRELDRAEQAGVRILEVFTIQPAITFGNATVYQVTEQVMQKLVFGDRNEGIVAVAEEPVLSFDVFETKLSGKTSPLLAVLEGIEKPGNLGAVFRSADAGGLDGVMIAESLVDPFHSNSIRSSMGTVFSVPMVSESSAVIYRWLVDRQFQIAAAWCGSAVSYTAVDFCRPTAIVLGSEAEGLTEIWSGKEITSVTLPMLGIADSLNVSVAAGILFYEARRQRHLIRHNQ